ncbi:hypothetical protein K402DRAFT_274762 [Aulographum hederae CBS 113979]|uniref:F-box domain-containing protein n=1 Tax=Aulographum hederae CBS 113979 TaxID=1176131 RepID=A0A6G1GID3_9PEZI|nr:hypothetical protein K402DRAFT_274762 [Aulographum hederae CBS 113979]
MAKQVSQIPQGAWYEPECKLCGGSVNHTNVKSYRAVTTLPGQENLDDVVPIFHQVRRELLVGPITSYSIRPIGTLPRLYLVHRHCERLIRFAAGSRGSTTPLLTIISVTTTHPQINTCGTLPISSLDRHALATRFNSRQAKDSAPAELSLRQHLLHLPSEIFLAILSYYQADQALAVTASLDKLFFNSVVKQDIARQRVTIGIQAIQLLECWRMLQQAVGKTWDSEEVGK